MGHAVEEALFYFGFRRSLIADGAQSAYVMPPHAWLADRRYRSDPFVWPDDCRVNCFIRTSDLLLDLVLGNACGLGIREQLVRHFGDGNDIGPDAAAHHVLGDPHSEEFCTVLAHLS